MAPLAIDLPSRLLKLRQRGIGHLSDTHSKSACWPKNESVPRQKTVFPFSDTPGPTTSGLPADEAIVGAYVKTGSMTEPPSNNRLEEMRVELVATSASRFHHVIPGPLVPGSRTVNTRLTKGGRKT